MFVDIHFLKKHSVSVHNDSLMHNTTGTRVRLKTIIIIITTFPVCFVFAFMVLLCHKAELTYTYTGFFWGERGINLLFTTPLPHSICDKTTINA